MPSATANSAEAPVKCEECGASSTRAELAASLWCCPACDFHLPMPAPNRLALIADEGTLGRRVGDAQGADPLDFNDSQPYAKRLARAREQTGEGESFIASTCTIGGVPAVVGAFDFAFMGGTMSAAVGERVAEVFECGRTERRAVVLFTASGGARMQEGTLSLFQMAKTAAARARLRDARVPYISVLAHPTLGGVSASFGNLSDVCLAEPKARIGFAGPRVIEQLVGSALPSGFQRAEFVFEHGFIDRIVRRTDQREELVRLVRLLSGVPAPKGV